mgnify:CR=1 FL=1|tara:strand:+ start:2358 stop:2642 length:285 start_codon:yes stop_codon:yes gene_type:complete
MKTYSVKYRIAALKRMKFEELKPIMLSCGLVINARNAEEERDIVLGAGHKARCATPENFTKKQLKESRKWLSDRGWKQGVNPEAIGVGNGETMQ